MKFIDCNGDALTVGDVVTLEGRKRRATIIKAHTTGELKGLMTLDPPLRHKDHFPEELERVSRQPPVTVWPAQPDTQVGAAFTQWLKATARPCNDEHDRYTVRDGLADLGDCDRHG